MKTKWNLVLLASLLVSVPASRAFAGEEKKTYPPGAAHDAMAAAFKQATSESKVVFAKSGFPECGWCRVFDRFHTTPEVQKILGKYCVIVAIDTKYMPDGTEVFSKYAQPGAPSWVILTADGKKIVDSYGPQGNVGYPLEPHETAHYVAALKKAVPAITEDELKILSEQIRKAAGK